MIDTTVGTLHLHTSERTLTIDGAPSPLRIAAFRGGALADEPIEPALDAIEAGAPALQIVIGSLGDDETHAHALLAALAGLASPTLVLLGGRDHPADLASGDAHPNVIDATGIRAIVIGDVELVAVSGAPEGRYARDDDSCGLGTSEVDAIARDVGQAGPRARFLVSYAAPSPIVGLEGAEGGSALIADLAARIGARPGLFAWPDVPSTMLVPPIVGAPALLSDGSRIGPGVLLVDVAPSGITLAH